MRFHNIIFAIFFITVLSSCSSTQYLTDSLQEVNASKYQTYEMEDNCADDINPIMQIRIKNALEKKLQSNSYTKNASADILVKYFVKNVSKKYLEECRKEYDRWEGGKFCQERVVTYEEGAIIIDMIDTRTNTIIWHGAAYGPSWSTVRNPNEKVNEVINNLLDRYFNS